MNCTIMILPQQKALTVPYGSNLMQVLRDAGFGVDAPCGGKGTCGKCKVAVDGKTVSSCRYTVESNITVRLPEMTGEKILSAGKLDLTEIDPLQPGYLAAIDIGTTTVVCALMDNTGRELAVQSMTNPQRLWGADVISRIQYAQKGQREVLTAAIRKGVQELLCKCCLQADVAAKEVGVISVVGNSCMQQLFLGMEVGNLASVPFAPAIRKSEAVNATEYFPDCPMRSS